MKKLSVLSAVAIMGVLSVAPAFAGPSRAIVQEMGSVIAKDEVNVDVDWLPTTLNVTPPTTATIGGGNGSIGGLALSSVNVSLIEGIELRLGRLPGLKSYISGLGNGSNLGLTVKGAIPGVPGLAAWVGYGANTTKDVNAADTTADTETSSIRIGAAYTWAGPVIVNGTLDYGVDTAKSAGVKADDTKTTEGAVAVLYPIRPTLLVGAEYHYASVDTGTTKFTVTAPALGARIVAGNFTLDAIAVFAPSVDPDTAGETISTTTVGVPTLRVNYKF